MKTALDLTNKDAPKDYRRLDISQIEPYDRNPRTLPNPKSRELKASLRASRGYHGVLQVTRRPGSEIYMVEQGGNTTLALLKELLTETEDNSFRFVTVDISDWSGDFVVMLQHYRENNVRGDLSFGERSREMVALYHQYCEDLAPEDGSKTAVQFLSELADQFGVSCAKSNFSLYRYTAETLAGVMPFLVLRTRLTRAQAVAIRTLHTKIRTVWCEKKVGTKHEFDEVFFGNLTRIDKGLEKTFAGDVADDPTTSVSLDETDLISALQNEFVRSESGDCTFSQAGVWITAALQSGPAIVRQASTDEPEDESQKENSEMLHSPAGYAANRAADTSTRPTNTRESNTAQSANPDGDDVTSSGPPLFPEEALSPPNDGDDVSALRRKAYGYASRIAVRNDITDIVVSVPDVGFGYLVTDAHDDVLQPAMGAISYAASAWWALAAGCALSTTPEAIRDRYMPEGSFLRTALDQNNAGLLTQSLPFQSFDQSGCVWTALKAKDFLDYLTIQRIHKAIATTAHGRFDLWTTPPTTSQGDGK